MRRRGLWCWGLGLGGEGVGRLGLEVGLGFSLGFLGLGRMGEGEEVDLEKKAVI